TDDVSWVRVDKQRVRSLARKRCKGRVDLTAGAGVEDLDSQPHLAPRGFRFFHLKLRARRIGRIDENGDTGHCGHQLAQKFQPLGHQFAHDEIDSGEVTARPGEAGNESELDRVVRDRKHDRNGCGRRLGCESRSGAAGRDDDGNTLANQIGRQTWQSVELVLGPAVFDRDVLAFGIACLLQSLQKSARSLGRRHRAEKADYRHRRLLRAYRERPRRRCASKQRDELPPFHSITSSARASIEGGSSRPSAFAVLRLITSSYFVGVCTGSSAGFSPLRMRSTYEAAWRYCSLISAP